MYIYLRNLLFLFPAETAHALSLRIISWLPNSLFPKPKGEAIECMGIRFPHKIGLAAGFDKNAKYLDAIEKLGFAFIEVGTVTPRPQFGNPKPRIFRLLKSQALINRMGFCNSGVDKLVMNIKRSKYQGVIGVNIGKNKDTPLEYAFTDYIYCLQRVYKYANYIAINISSPNTTDLRKLQEIDYFDEFISKIIQAHQNLVTQHNTYVPIVIKVSPDESSEVLKNIAEVALKYKIDAIIATNTSCARFDIKDKNINENGGLSGKPIFELSNSALLQLKSIVGDKIALIGVGGIDDIQSAKTKLECGASLLQVYTGFIYKGPKLVRDLNTPHVGAS